MYYFPQILECGYQFLYSSPVSFLWEASSHVAIGFELYYFVYVKYKPINVVMVTDYVYILYTVEPRFNEVAGDRPNLFVKWRVRYIENLDITNLRGNNQNVRYIEVIVND